MKRSFFVMFLIAIMTFCSAFSAFASGDNDISADYEESINEHVEYIKSELLRYDESTSYFEKYGISMDLRDYFTDNEFDLYVTEIAELYAVNEEHISVLLSMVEEYDLLLKENANVFIEKCDELMHAEDYLTLKRLCDEARFCFLNMDVSVDGVQDAIVLYQSKLDSLRDMENRANIFIKEVDTLCRATDSDNKLALIISSNNALSFVDRGVSGVAEAIEKFEAAMAEYDSSIANAYSETAITRRYAVSLTNHEGQDGFIAYILDRIG